ncbi:hypothetical protein E3E29_08650 [Thermococcus sp. Bubb.Bath]|nr:hypothetical protein [Thermococcus sp. Bubb.Bath]NJF25701.1 hypothetical protein [Thermococcus sp. Bubb.Bath]
MAYIGLRVPCEKLPYLAPYLFLSIPAVKRKALPYGAAALFSSLFIEWKLTGSYLTVVGMAAAFLTIPLRVERQPVKFWERGLNVVIAGAIAYVGIVSPDWGIKVGSLLAALALLSSNRALSSGGLLMASGILITIPLANLSDLNHDIFMFSSTAILLYSLLHLRKLLR